MTEQDERLSAELRDYYRRLAEQPAPDVTGRVMMATELRAARLRRWGAVGGGLVAVAAVAGVVVVALVNHSTPAGTGPGHGSSSAPTATPTAGGTPAPSSVVPVGPAAHGFVPTDVTAVSAAEWWVLGDNGFSCLPGTCTAILRTTDGGQSFTSVPVPAVTLATNGQEAERLRFADPLDGWLVSGAGTVWATHDGGGHWIPDSSAGVVTDLEASGGNVYAVACTGANGCTVERSPTVQDTWSTLPASGGHGNLNHLSVNGAHVWVAIESQAGGLGWLLASTDSGQNFTMQTACPSALGYANEYAVDSTTLWATCATGTEASAFQSLDGGQQFTQLAGTVMLPNSASIAGVSSTTAVIAGQGLLRTTDGGRTFSTVLASQAQWSIAGFTTAQHGFAFEVSSKVFGPAQLWRTNDAGAHWYMVRFP
jgi:photosystem II stability/assembly factor-like uncharacterized protein